MKMGSFEMDLREENGVWQLAPLSFWNADKKELEDNTGGCGPGTFGDWLVPDSTLGQTLYPACRKHDWMYYKAETEEDKIFADVTFRVNMTFLIIDEDNVLDRVRLQVELTYFCAVYYHGGGAFSKEDIDSDNLPVPVNKIKEDLSLGYYGLPA